ncbi:hypothetical protein TanjilG_27751 [Lupinus angustifolius]|uniref:Uncharacterized protein n=1 Tax=Lupinus angustifolius TaxID=3871 RepID=A0A4P1RH42_LUPAN|nr:hypothetical protein TanjilG_27751 [Lupinus angustifolius]
MKPWMLMEKLTDSEERARDIVILKELNRFGFCELTLSLLLLVLAVLVHYDPF